MIVWPEADRLASSSPIEWHWIGTPVSGGPKRVRSWRTLLAAVFVMLALAGCAQRTTGQIGAPYAPYPPETNGIRPEHGGGDGGGGGGMYLAGRGDCGPRHRQLNARAGAGFHAKLG
jgi:hypothetical protein